MRRDRHHCGSANRIGGPQLFGTFAALVYFAWGAAAADAVQFVRLDYNFNLPSRARSTAFIELYDADRPLTVDNFLDYVHGNRYDGTIMHRLARNFVVQGGGFRPEFQEEPFPLNFSLDPSATVDRDGNPNTQNPMIPNEFANPPMRSNVRGTLAMARFENMPNSATNQWFVNLKNNSNPLDTVDGGFTVFGRVLGDGMAIFDAINGAQIINLNPDTNDDGTRDSGPFGMSATDGLPVLQSINENNEIESDLVILEIAKHITYFGAGMNTDVAGGIGFLTRDAFFDTGAGFFGAGEFTIGTQRALGIRENFATGRVINNNGTLRPGLELGTIQIGTLKQSETGTLEIQLGGATVNTEYDRVAMFNAAELGGTLEVSLIDGFVPAPGNSFTILTASSITGDFDTIELPMLDAGRIWNIDQSNAMFTLSVAYADFNRDGIVNSADYTMWRDTRGSTVAAYTGADANGDGMITDADYTIWKSNFGNGPGNVPVGGAGAVAAAAVPEPGTILLLMAGALGASLRRRRRCVI